MLQEKIVSVSDSDEDSKTWIEGRWALKGNHPTQLFSNHFQSPCFHSSLPTEKQRGPRPVQRRRPHSPPSGKIHNTHSPLLCLLHPSLVLKCAGLSFPTWRSISLFVCIPCMFLFPKWFFWNVMLFLLLVFVKCVCVCLCVCVCEFVVFLIGLLSSRPLSQNKQRTKGAKLISKSFNIILLPCLSNEEGPSMEPRFGGIWVCFPETQQPV